MRREVSPVSGRIGSQGDYECECESVRSDAIERVELEQPPGFLIFLVDLRIYPQELPVLDDGLKVELMRCKELGDQVLRLFLRVLLLFFPEAAFEHRSALCKLIWRDDEVLLLQIPDLFYSLKDCFLIGFNLPLVLL